MSLPANDGVNRMANPKVTVYIPNHNYGRFVEQAIESVLNQKFSDWELIIVDDGSTDGSHEIIRKYEDAPNVHVVVQENRGLTVSSNIALRLSKGKYIMRLDADDYLDENALLVLSNILDTHLSVGLVYPDYYLVDDSGEILGIERRNKVGQEIMLYDVPAHGACTMIRKQCLQELGGYSEDITCQDGYDLWIRFIEKFGVYNVNIPLFYYRQHAKNLSRNQEKILRTRRMIKRRHIERSRKRAGIDLAAIIPVRGKDCEEPAYALRQIAGRPLIDYTITAALESQAFNKVVVVSEDEVILNYAQGISRVVSIKRPPELARANTPIAPTVRFVLDHLEGAPRTDAFMLLYVNSPLRRDIHIRNAIDTMLIFDVDSVISVYEELSNHYLHVGTGLRPLFQRRTLRLEKEALWVENGAIYLSKVGDLRENDYLGEKIGHIVMLRHESVQIDTEEDFRLVEYMLNIRRREEGLTGHGD